MNEDLKRREDDSDSDLCGSSRLTHQEEDLGDKPAKKSLADKLREHARKKGTSQRVEPASDLIYSPTSPGEVVRESVDEAVDVNLYSGAKLCLSDQDYYSLGDWEERIERGLEGEIARSKSRQLITNFLQRDQDTARVYIVGDSDLLDIDLTRYDAVEIAHYYPDIPLATRNTAIIDKAVTKPEVIDKGLSRREYGPRRFSDKYTGNNFSVYLLTNEVLDNDGANLYRAISLELTIGDNSELLALSTSSAHSLSYGYRVRIYGVEDSEVRNLI